MQDDSSRFDGSWLLSVAEIFKCQKDEEELARNDFDIEKIGHQETKLEGGIKMKQNTKHDSISVLPLLTFRPLTAVVYVGTKPQTWLTETDHLLGRGPA